MTDTIDRIILAIDTNSESEALHLLRMARVAGITRIKIGLELATAIGWRRAAWLAQGHGFEWVADAKLCDIPNTVVGAVKSLLDVPHPPFAITMHATSGFEAMEAAQKTAGDVKMLAVTVLTSITDTECHDIFGAQRERAVHDLAERVMNAGVAGIVCSGREVKSLAYMERWLMVPGTRSQGAEANDQRNIVTPAQAIRDGADALVIGRQVTKAADPAQAVKDLVAEIEGANA